MPFNFLVLYIYKMVAGLLVEGESPVRTLQRLILLFVAPGLSDHWPSDYERKLRRIAMARGGKASLKSG